MPWSSKSTNILKDIEDIANKIYKDRFKTSTCSHVIDENYKLENNKYLCKICKRVVTKQGENK